MNPELKKQLTMMGVLGAVLVGVLVWQFTKSGPSSSRRGSSGGGAAADEERAAEDLAFLEIDIDVQSLVKTVKVLEFDYVRERVQRDPMESLITGSGIAQLPGEGPSPEDQIEQERLDSIYQKVVSGIVYDAVNPFAVVDNDIVRRGMTYTNAVYVVSIEPNAVLFSYPKAKQPVKVPLRD